MAYTNSILLSSIKRRALIPNSQQTFQDDELLDMASEVIESFVMPLILQSRQEFYVTYDDIAITKRSSDNFGWIRIPQRAIGQSIVEVRNTNDYPLDSTDYWVEGSKIYFGDASSGTYRVYYYIRPSKLVEVSECGRITDINTTTGEITVSSVPSDFTTSLEYDFVRGKASFDTLGRNLTASAVGASSITFTASDLPSELVVGDYVATSDESPIPQIPVEWFNYLAQLTAVQVLESIGDHEAMKLAAAKLEKMEKHMLSLISPRIEKKAKAIVRPFYDEPYDF